MKQRIITALVALAIFVPCLIFSDKIVFDILIAIICGIAVFEVLRCLHLASHLTILVPSLILALFVPFTARQINLKMGYPVFLLSVVIVYMLYIFSASMFSKGKIVVTDAALAAMMTLYVIMGFGGILYIRGLGIAGEFIYWIIFISSWIPDTGAYFVGVKFGKHKLIPDVSPKKTVEGAIGGIVTCVLVFIIYTVIVNAIGKIHLNYFLMILAGVILAVASMIGDLIASLVKRHYKTKDYGKILPGHGGVMDRFDSVLATSSILFVLSLIPAFMDNLLV